LLLERLAKIVQKKTLDNTVHESVAMHQKLKKKISITRKRIEMQKITEENQRLLKRIQEVPPAYNHLEWEEEARERELVKKQMALYPEYYDRLEKEKAQKKNAIDASKAKTSDSPTLPPI
jgi:E3 ubiquitin-protein ligase TRIP12